MELTVLNSYINRLEEMREALVGHDAPNEHLNKLIYDLATFYRDNYAHLPPTYRKAWGEAVNRRLQWMPDVHANIRNAFLRLKADWNGQTTRITLPLRFGQMRVGPSFAAAGNAHQNNAVGLPMLAGQTLNATAGQITGGNIAADSIIVQIFLHTDLWVVVNNRGFTAHCIAQTRPLRLIPRIPEQAELNRLREVENQGDIPNFTGPQSGQLIPRPHRLPAIKMPITTGPGTFVVERVVNIPPNWF